MKALFCMAAKDLSVRKDGWLVGVGSKLPPNGPNPFGMDNLPRCGRKGRKKGHSGFSFLLLQRGQAPNRIVHEDCVCTKVQLHVSCYLRPVMYNLNQFSIQIDASDNFLNRRNGK